MDKRQFAWHLPKEQKERKRRLFDLFAIDHNKYDEARQLFLESMSRLKKKTRSKKTFTYEYSSNRERLLN